MQILGFTIFMNNKFKVSKDTLIPRVETELLIRTCENLISQNSKVLEIGCGSGIISIMLNKIKNCKVDSCDISIEALKIAKLNSKNLQTNVNFFYSDLFKNVNSKYDLIVSNPPYIPTAVLEGLEKEVTEFEPRLALDGGKDGLDLVRILFKEALLALKPKGVIALELFEGHLEQAADLYQKAGFTDVRIVKDLTDRPRVLIGHAPQ